MLFVAALSALKLLQRSSADVPNTSVDAQTGETATKSSPVLMK
jgi:hypothetical protein